MLFKSLLTMASLASMTLALPAPGVSRRQNILFKSQGTQQGSYYYEDAHDGDACAADGSQGAGWANNQITGVTMCESSVSNSPLNLAQLNSNRIVAISNVLLRNGMNGNGADLCGKQVNVYLNGQPFSFSEGPLFIWDGCERCASTSGLDFSGQAYAEMFGDCRSGLSTNTNKKMTFEVVDVTIMEPNSNGVWADGQASSATYSGGSPVHSSPVSQPTSSPIMQHCQWDGHCLGATCSRDEDCSDPWGCVNGKCGVDN